MQAMIGAIIVRGVAYEANCTPARRHRRRFGLITTAAFLPFGGALQITGAELDIADNKPLPTIRSAA
jgi:hypothetical protein